VALKIVLPADGRRSYEVIERKRRHCSGGSKQSNYDSTLNRAMSLMDPPQCTPYQITSSLHIPPHPGMLTSFQAIS
jgi:hypothetical protein